MPQKQVLDTQALLSSYIDANRRTIRCHRGLGTGLAAFGLTIVVAGALWPGRISDKILPVFAGVCVSAFTSFPIKEIRTRQEKIEIIESIQNRPFASADDETRVHELIWKALEKTIAG